MARRVRSHTRSKPGGGKTNVSDHNRRGRPAHRPLLSPRHAWDLFKRAGRAGKRRKRGLALTLGALGALELGAWASGRTFGLILTTGGALAIMAGLGAWHMTGGQPK